MKDIFFLIVFEDNEYKLVSVHYSLEDAKVHALKFNGLTRILSWKVKEE